QARTEFPLPMAIASRFARESLRPILGSSSRHGPRQKIGENETVALDDFAHLDRDFALEHGPRIRERVELAILAARVHARRQFAEQMRIESPASKRTIELARVNTR